MTNPFNMQVIVLEGTPRQRGRIHGETLRTEIQDFMAAQTAGLSESDIQMYTDMLIAETRFLAAAEKWVPDTVEEIRGIAEGANMLFHRMFIAQLLDEGEWFFNSKRMGLLEADRCSALGVYGDNQPTLLAQNADMGKVVDGKMKLLHVKDPSGHEAYRVTIPGVVGVYGLNSDGVGVCLNAMGGQMNKSIDGLGTVLVSQGVLAQKSFDAAVEFITSIQHATGENYTIGGKGEVAAFECSANQVKRLTPTRGTVYHTNHPLESDDRDTTYLPRRIEETPEAKLFIEHALQNTRTRCESLESRLQDLPRPVTVDMVKSVLGAHDSDEHPVCRHPREDTHAMTNVCMIMELDEPRITVAPGPPCMTEFRTFSFD